MKKKFFVGAITVVIAGLMIASATSLPISSVSTTPSPVWNFTTEQTVVCGDINGDGNISIADVVPIINYLFIGGPAPSPRCAGDVNNDNCINIADIIYLINYLFMTPPGPAPNPDCCNPPWGK